MKLNLFKKLLVGAACYPFVAIAENAVTVNDNTLNPKVDETADSTRWQLDLNEIVVTGQGSAIQKRRLSNNVQTIKADEFVSLQTDRLDQLLQTALPNMKVNMSSGQPGSTSVMLSRGLSSAYGNSTPVIYVDGVRVDNLNTASALTNDLDGGNYTTGFAGQTTATSAISDIPMENIDHIEYVSGGAATTLYGSDAANGVIQIFTKKGGKSGFNASLTAELGAEQATSDFNFFHKTKDLINQTGFTQKYRLSMDGGGQRGGWSLGASMAGNEGIVVGNANEQKKYDVRFGTNYNITKQLEYQGSFGAVVQHLRYARNGNEGLYGGLWTTECGALTGLTYTDANGTKQNYSAYIDDLDDNAFSQLKQLCYDGESLSNHREKVTRFQMSHGFTYKPLQNLTLKAILGMDYRHTNNKYTITYEWLQKTQQITSMPVSSMRNFDRDYMGITMDANGQYRFRSGSFSAITTAGFQLFTTDDHQTTILGKDLRDGALTISSAATKTADEYKSTLKQYGGYLQENIGFFDRYYIDLGVRGDYNTAFGDNVGWQYYPKAGISYMLSSEPFMQQQNVVNQARIFVNYGVAGNYPPAFSYQRTISFSSYQGALAASLGQYGNDDLGPEKKRSFEAGMNTQLLSRLNIGFTYYYSRTKNALFNIPLPPSVGESNYLANVGDIENKGVELNLGIGIINTKDWEASVTASLNTNKNLVLSTGGATAFAIGGFGTSTIQSVVEEGQPIGILRATRTDIVDGKAMTQTYQNLGKTMPTAYGALSVNVRWKDLTFFANADYQWGGHVHSYNRQFLFRKGVVTGDVPDDMLIALGMNADGSNRSTIQKTQAFNLTNYFVYKSDFLKLRNIGVTYEFKKPCRLLKSVLVGFHAYNLFTVTNCPVDPEATVSSTLTQGSVATGGFNYATYSSPRQYIGSVKLTF